MSHTYWNLLPPVERGAAVDGIHPLIVQLLYNRGISGVSQTELFLNVDRRLENDPFLLHDMHQAVGRVYQALFSGEQIAIYGDFDADGITATALLVQGISAIGGRVIPYIPHRISEGYGLTVPALQRLRAQGVNLVITVDTGITALAEVERAQKMGMDIIITDHHVPLSTLPQSDMIINPKRRDSIYPFTELAGVGVAFKLLQAILKGNGQEELTDKLLDLVALGTVADMVPLVNENRYWVKRGLEIINDTQRLGLQEMIRLAGIQIGNLDSETISWGLAPRLNAAGRLDNATTSYQLLLTQNPQEAVSLALDIEEKNTERRRLTNELVSKAREDVIADGVDLPLLMTCGEDYAPGIVGLVAGRLSQEFYRPVVVLKLGQESSRGSGRSISEFNLMDALEDCSDLLSEYGGHASAAGFSLPTRNLEQFQQRLLGLAKDKLAGLDLRPRIDIDAEVPLSIFAEGIFEKTQQLAPFGRGNPLPVFVSRGIGVIDQRNVGSNGEHLKLKLGEKGTVWDAIGFGLGNLGDEITSCIDIVYSLNIDRWNGRQKLQINLLDFAPAD